MRTLGTGRELLAGPARVFLRFLKARVQRLVWPNAIAAPRAWPDAIAIQAGLADLVVKHGPFAGMRYSEPLPPGCIFYPKLLGAYEAELEPVMERIARTDYTAVVDVGCADGYFAVGLAMRLPRVIVHAYDISPEMRAICARNADVNGVADRVRISEQCDSRTLGALSLGDRAFILCDCEGFERELFPASVVPRLAHHDLLIEVHDFIDLSIRDTLQDRFAATHDVEIISSVDDNLKGDVFEYPELAGKGRAFRKEVLADRRPCIMQWLVLTSRAAKAQASGT